MYDALVRHHAIEALVTRKVSQGQLRKYYRFRADRWYGGIATADVVGCGLLCKFCWVSDAILERPADSGRFLTSREAAQRLLRIAESRHVTQVRLSGGEPTIGRAHLLDVLSEFDRGRGIKFILETNGILLGADQTYSRDLAGFDCLHVRVSLKGASQSEFEILTSAKGFGFELQINALRHLHDAAVSCHPAVMRSFSTRDSVSQLSRRLSAIDRGFADNLEIEELIRYARVERRLRKHGLVARVSHDPMNISGRLV